MHAKKHARELKGQHALELLFGHLADPNVCVWYIGVIELPVKPTISGCSSLNRPHYIRSPQDVGPHELSFRSRPLHLLAHRFTTSLIHVRRGDERAALGREQSSGSANTGGTAGDDCRFAV